MNNSYKMVETVSEGAPTTISETNSCFVYASHDGNTWKV